MLKRGVHERHVPVFLVTLFILLASGIIAIGHRYYRGYEQSYRTEIEQQLLAVSNLKAEELLQWRKERLSDAAVFYNNSAFSALALRFLSHPEDEENARQLKVWLQKTQEAYGYNAVMLLDPQYRKRMVIPDVLERPVSRVSPGTAVLLEQGKIGFEDFYWNEEDERIYLKILVPLFDGGQRDRFLGVLSFRIDPERYLYPFLQVWPSHSLTAETLLVRQDGDDVLYLNELKFQKKSALQLRIPLDRTEVTTVVAVKGREGIVEGVDYRGVRVITAIKSIPGSPWFLVARIDRDEVFAPVRMRWRMVVLFVCALIFGSGAVVGLIWRQQRDRFRLARQAASESLHESETRMSAIATAARDAILMMDPNGAISYWNPAAARILGYSHEEAVGQPLHDLLAPSRYREAYQQAFPEFQKTGQGSAVGKTLELHARCKDGREIAVALSLSAVRIKDQWHAVGILRDITEQVRASEALRESEERFRILFEASHDAMMIIEPPDWRFTSANPATLEMFRAKNLDDFFSYTPGQLSPGIQEDGTASPEKAVAMIETALLEGSHLFEWTHSRIDGEIFPAVVLLTRMEFGGKTILQATVRDITAQKQAEQDLRRAMEDIEEANRQLEAAIGRANQMAIEAQAANIAKSQFLANMSHHCCPKRDRLGQLTRLS